MKSAAIRSSRQSESNAGTIRAEISLDLAVPLREPVKLSLPLSCQAWQVHARADPAAGSTVNEYKTSLQLPGSHLGIHLAATHPVLDQPGWTSSLEDQLPGVPGPIRSQGIFVCAVVV